MEAIPPFLVEALRGRYRIERRLGEGGMATVYLAEDERHNRRVAVKVLRPEVARTIGVERFNREIGIAARLNHPHILPLLDSGTIHLGNGLPDSVYYVMPFVPGESLRDRLLREGKLPVADAIRLAREVADALDHAHRHGVIHRDIKPENILLSEQHAVVADFGIARALDEAGSGNITQTGQSIGTPTYMSPEQVTGEQMIDGRTDLYALGCTLYEMLAGEPPWTGGSVQSMLARRLAEPPPRIRETVPSVPPAIEEALCRSLAVQPADRFATPAEFAAALEIGTAARPVAPPAVKRRWRTVLPITAVVLAVGGFALTKLARPGRAEAITSIAIAPAQGDTATAYLSEGMLDAVANLLRRIPQLRVTAPSLVAQIIRQQPSLNNLQLGEQLNVGAVLTWALGRARDSVAVSVELLKIPGGDLLWSARYARPMADVAALQGYIARSVSDSLRIQLSGVEVAAMDRRPTASGEAYQLYLRGRRFSIRAVPLLANDAENLMDSAAAYAREAIALDSSFAQAYGLLGVYYFVSAFRGWLPFAENLDSARAVAARALRADSSLGDPWVNTLSAGLYLDDDWPGVIETARRAMRWSAHDAQVLQSVGIVLGEVEGRIDSAITVLRKSVELEPFSANLNTLGDLYMRAGRYDSAVASLRRSLDIDPSVPGPRRRLIHSLEQLGRYPEAVAVRRAGGDSSGAAAYEGGLREAGAAGYEKVRREDLQRQLALLLAPVNRPYKLPDDTVPQLREERIVALYAQLEDWTRAMDWGIKLYERRPRRFRLIVTNPTYRSLRSDPRFLPMVRREGLEPLLPR